MLQVASVTLPRVRLSRAFGGKHVAWTLQHDPEATVPTCKQPCSTVALHPVTTRDKMTVTFQRRPLAMLTVDMTDAHGSLWADAAGQCSGC